MGKTVIFIIIVCVLFVIWSACVLGARADEQMQEIMSKEQKKKKEEVDMTKERTCSRCGMPTGNTYYKIDICARSNGPSATTEAFSYNLAESLRRANSQETVYCKNCKNKIEQYMRMDIRRVMTESWIRPPVKKQPKKGE